MTASYKTALITGASSGLGRGLAAAFAKKGVKVYAAARRRAELDELAREVGEHLVPWQLDVSDGDATYARVRELDGECGGLDLVIANAGVGLETHGKRLDWSAVKRTIDVNVTGACATLAAPLPGMLERGRGQLVGISSLAAFVAAPRMGAYCASKAFLATFLDSLRHDVGRRGVTVTSVHPGYVKSEMTAKNKPGSMPFLLETDDAVQRMVRAIEKQVDVFAFPWQLSTPLRVLTTLPGGVGRALVGRFG